MNLSSTTSEIDMANRFHEWIKQRGPEKVARRIGVTTSTVNRWRNGTFPNALHVHALLKMGRGKFKREDIFARPEPQVTQEERDAMQKLSDRILDETRGL